MIASSKTLAIDGGSAVRTQPFPARASLGEDEANAISALIKTASASRYELRYGGPEQCAYEAEFAAFHGGGHAKLLNSGTTALYALLLALDLERPGEIIVPAITDAGGVMPVALANYSPVPADVAAGSYLVSASQVSQVLTDRTRAIIVAHIGGDPVDMEELVDLARTRDIALIEDCAQAHGAVYRNAMVGRFGHAAVFSTMVGKHHCTGGQGGVVLTNDAALAERVAQCTDRGKTHSNGATVNARAALNLNGSDLAAAIGRVQLRKLPQRLVRRRALADDLVRATANQALQALEPMHGLGAHWFVRVRYQPQQWRQSLDAIVAALNAEGVPATRWGDMPHAQPWFAEGQALGVGSASWTTRAGVDPTPEANRSIATHFTLPLHENWSCHEIEAVVDAFAKLQAVWSR